MPKQDMNKPFHVLSINRNDILLACKDYLLDRPIALPRDAHLYPEAKTFVENMSDDDVIKLIKDLCDIKYIFQDIYAMMGLSIKSDLEKK